MIKHEYFSARYSNISIDVRERHPELWEEVITLWGHGITKPDDVLKVVVDIVAKIISETPCNSNEIDSVNIFEVLTLVIETVVEFTQRLYFTKDYSDKFQLYETDYYGALRIGKLISRLVIRILFDIQFSYYPIMQRVSLLPIEIKASGGKIKLRGFNDESEDADKRRT